MESGTEQLHSTATDARAEVKVARALLSVSDKTAIVEFARGLSQLGIEIVSTGGTATALAEAGIPVRSISELTGFPEIMDGRVKTLHPRLYAGVLALRHDVDHLQAAEEHEVEFIDLVCVNLYPFERTAARRGVSEPEVIENIDIGGPTLIRAAAKNWRYVAPVTTPESYDAILAELRESGRRLSDATRESLAAEAFAVTARYDAAIARWFQEKREDFPPLLLRAYEKALELAYGENPHQRAAYYTQVGTRTHVLSAVSQLGGKQLSFNNLLDLNAARQLLAEFQVPACVIVKHNNPCGVALGSDALEAYRRAFGGDPLSAYGGVVCLNRRVERALAEALVGQFIEVLFAPGYEADALEALQNKPNMRILDDREQRGQSQIEADLRQVAGGLLVQDRDSGLEQREEMNVVSARIPTDAEWSEALFAWKVCKHVRSNAIVLSAGLQTVGIGAGQMSRVDAVKIALEKAGTFWEGNGRRADRSVAMASDAFFPFPDSAELATAAGVTVVIEPGGSIRDQQVIEAVNEAGAAMIFTSRRHFRH
jgi:phosphoribosylaminoimidazolecarboxamide formyltransferase/IMP cyclohydrolase